MDENQARIDRFGPNLTLSLIERIWGGQVADSPLNQPSNRFHLEMAAREILARFGRDVFKLGVALRAAKGPLTMVILVGDEVRDRPNATQVRFEVPPIMTWFKVECVPLDRKHRKGFGEAVEESPSFVEACSLAVEEPDVIPVILVSPGAIELVKLKPSGDADLTVVGIPA